MKKHIFYTKIAAVQAVVAFFGSMYFSDIAGYPPCTLCWYQRIAMFPLAILLAVAISNKDWSVYRYVLPLAGIGWIIASYHNLLYYKIIADTGNTCSMGISCTSEYVSILGIFTIPLLAWIAFSVIIVFMILSSRELKKS